jgi:hypothetical protein
LSSHVQVDGRETDWLAEPLTHSAGFQQLIATAGGRHPIELLAGLKTLACGSGTLAPKALQFCLEAEALEPARFAAQGDGLPLPHPLDFEWRFTDTTADDLIARSAAVTQPGDPIVLLGVPSVVVAAARSHHDRAFCVLMERNAVGTTIQGLVQGDRRFTFGSRPHSAGAAVVDPPWYPGPLSDLLALAVAQCRDGAQVLMSAPPLGLRAGGAEERKKLLEMARGLGLELREQQPAALRYRSPAFELAALRAAEVGMWLPDWRTGDLFTLSVAGQPQRPSNKLRARPTFELTLGGVRVRIQAERPVGATEELRAVHVGEVLPSVSARDPRRVEGNLWTSGNRVFSIDPKTGLHALVTMAKVQNLWPKRLDSPGTDLGNLGSIDRVELLIHQLDDVIVRESLQMAQLVGDAAWAKSVSDARFLNGSANAFLESLRGISGSSHS